MSKLKYPPVLQWEVTPECNHECIHCYNYWRQDKRNLPKVCGKYDKIADKIVVMKPVHCVITGGEPLLVFDEIKNIIKKLINNNIYVSINTNATLITNEIASFMKENNISAFISFPCSDPQICDKITNTKGSYNNINRGLRILSDYNVSFVTNMVVSTINLDMVYETAKYVKENFDCKTFYASRVAMPINATENFQNYLLSYSQIHKLIQIMIKIQYDLNLKVNMANPIPLCTFESSDAFDMYANKRVCTAGVFSYAVDCVGNIKACPQDQKVYGNMLEEDFNVIWDNMDEWRTNELIPRECKKCLSLDFCKAGCRLNAFPIIGQRDALDLMANINNIPIKYKTARRERVYDKTEVYCVNEIFYVCENNGLRISIGSKYLYITEKLADFLIDNKEFKVDKFCSYFESSEEKCFMAINSLIEGGFIVKK